MIAFRFSLDRVLEWRRAQLELADAEFRRRAGALAAAERACAEADAAAVRTEAEVRRWNPVGGSDLAALGGYRIGVRARREALGAQREQCARAASAQQVLLLEARRRCRLLEKLRERRLAEWKSARDREIEELAAESYLARWGSGGAPRL